MTRTYNIWKLMKKRCFNPNSNVYHHYGGRGITICEKWMKFEGFIADMGESPSGMSIDRFPDNNGNYCKENCRWATRGQQARNTRKNVVIEFSGKKLTVQDWAVELGIHVQTIWWRIYHGWDHIRALTQPVKR